MAVRREARQAKLMDVVRRLFFGCTVKKIRQPNHD